MGGAIARKLSKDGHEVVAWNRSQAPLENLKSQISNLKSAETIEDLIRSLEKPRIVWIMLPHDAVDKIVGKISKLLVRGDIVIDGGNSNYKDSDKRFAEFRNLGIHFLGIGVSGGVEGERNGYAFMAGGSLQGYEKIKPILESLSKPNGSFEYFGEGGAGHFVKMVHNGVEYGMMQSIGEGLEILEKSKYHFDLSKVVRVWQKGTIISSFLIDKISEQLEKDKTLSEFAGPIARGGEGDWALEVAKEEGLNPEIIDESVDFRKRSEKDEKIQNSFTAKVINALRSAFGGHKVKKN